MTSLISCIPMEESVLLLFRTIIAVIQWAVNSLFVNKIHLLQVPGHERIKQLHWSKRKYFEVSEKPVTTAANHKKNKAYSQLGKQAFQFSIFFHCTVYQVSKMYRLFQLTNFTGKTSRQGTRLFQDSTLLILERCINIVWTKMHIKVAARE